MSTIEETQNMIDSLRKFSLDEQVNLLEDFKLEWLGDIDEGCLKLINTRLEEIQSQLVSN